MSYELPSNRRNQCPRGGLVIRFGVLLLCLVPIAGCEAIWTLLRDDRRPNRYLIPESFVGWVRIDYEVEGAPELPVADGFRVYRIPPSGHLQTSSSHQAGWASDEYYYVQSSGRLEPIPATTRKRGGLIWGGWVGYFQVRGEEAQIYKQLFIGPEKLFKQYAKIRYEEPPHGKVLNVVPPT